MKDIQEGEDEKKEQPESEAQKGASALAHSDPDAKETSVNHDKEPPFRMPPLTAIAGVLIHQWAEGKAQGSVSGLQKGNL